MPVMEEFARQEIRGVATNVLASPQREWAGTRIGQLRAAADASRASPPQPS